MIDTRRDFVRALFGAGVAATTASLFTHRAAAQALAHFGASDYKAVVVISLAGGNDGNNTIVPLDKAGYAAYSQIRPSLAVPVGSLQPLYGAVNPGAYGLHPALTNVAALYNARRASVVANIGPLAGPVSKAQIVQNSALYPGASLSHPTSVLLWESGQGGSIANTGWGGRIADYFAADSGSLAPVLSNGGRSLFSVGKTVQATAIQSGSNLAELDERMNAVVQQLADSEKGSSNVYVHQVASVRSDAAGQQVLLDKAAGYRSLKTSFGTSLFSQAMQKVARLLAGRSVLSASRQIFYVQQGNYDTHQNQADAQWASLDDLDKGLGAFFNALDELGLSNQVMVCTHSDFGRTLQANSTGGTDHGWGNHHFVLGGGTDGGRILGTMPEMTLGGSGDFKDQGIWIPSLAATQMTAGIGRWFGLTKDQLADVFPELQNFSSGALAL